MKYSFMSFSCPELSLEQIFELADKYGYDGIEPRLQANHKHGIEIDTDAAARQQIRSKIAQWGKTVCCLATSCRYADPATQKENVEITHQIIDLAGDIGCERLRVFGGKMGDGLDRQAAVALVAEALASVADHAKERGVYVCMETHDDWCDPEHVAQVIKTVNHPNIVVNWDIMHPVRTEITTMEKAFAALKPWIKHIHFHDGTLGQCILKPVGEGAIDHKVALDCLASINYDGFLSGEWINWEPYDTHLPRELAAMKAYEQAN